MNVKRALILLLSPALHLAAMDSDIPLIPIQLTNNSAEKALYLLHGTPGTYILNPGTQIEEISKGYESKSLDQIITKYGNVLVFHNSNCLSLSQHLWNPAVVAVRVTLSNAECTNGAVIAINPDGSTSFAPRITPHSKLGLNSEATAYEILGISPDANKDMIHRAFMKRIASWHPDRNSDPLAAEICKLINSAYSSLKK